MADKNVLAAPANIDTLELEAEVRSRRCTSDRCSRRRPGIVAALLFALSCFHYYTAGFGLLRETTHRGIHLAFVLGLIFLVFAARTSRQNVRAAEPLLAPGGIHVVDWALAIAAVLRLDCTCPGSSTTSPFRVGNPIDDSMWSWAPS